MNIENRVKKLLLRVGVDPARLGYDYLTTAVVKACDDKTYLRKITHRLYPEVADEHDTTVGRAERAIRHAIEKAYANNPDISEVLYILPSYNAGKITNGSFIAACAEIAKMEEDENA